MDQILGRHRIITIIHQTINTQPLDMETILLKILSIQTQICKQDNLRLFKVNKVHGEIHNWELKTLSIKMWTILKTLMTILTNGINLHQTKHTNLRQVSGISHLRTLSLNRILMINHKSQFIEKPFSILHSKKVKNQGLLSVVFSNKLEESPVLINRWEAWMSPSNKKMVWMFGLILSKLLTGIL